MDGKDNRRHEERIESSREKIKKPDNFYELFDQSVILDKVNTYFRHTSWTYLSKLVYQTGFLQYIWLDKRRNRR